MSNSQILAIEDARVLIGGKIFFDDMRFSIAQGQKIALVGKNGAGKTTLMNMISGAKPLDDGQYWLAPNTSIGYMLQNISQIQDINIKDFILKHIDYSHKDNQEDQEYLIDIVLTPLSLTANMRMRELSGGQMRRVVLAQALINEPNILLLDEPTNHMDLDIIQWLENYIRNLNSAVVCVSHDKRFLKEISDKVFWLDRGNLKISPEGFAKFDEWSQELLDHEARSLHNRQKQVELEMAWANRGVKARVKRNVRRLSQAHSDKKQLEKDLSAFRRINAQIKLPPLKPKESAQIMAEFFSCHKKFEQSNITILKDFNLRIMKGEKIGIVGKNGCGKSSFLKLLIKELSPDQGKVKLAKDIDIAYFDQHRSQLNINKTIQDNLCVPGNDHLSVRGKMRHICGYIKDFMFDPQDAWRPVNSLSGGQINRLMLAKILANPGNLMILDEPTNDLDMDMLDMLQDILLQYQGTLLLVSHDRDFLDNIVDKMLIFEGEGHVEGIIGGFSDYEAFVKAKKQQQQQQEQKQKIKKTQQQEQIKEKQSGLSFAQAHELEKLPDEIAQLEQKKQQIEQILSDSKLYMQQPEEFDRYSKEFVKINKKLVNLEERWLYLSDLS